MAETRCLQPKDELIKWKMFNRCERTEQPGAGSLGIAVFSRYSNGSAWTLHFIYTPISLINLLRIWKNPEGKKVAKENKVVIWSTKSWTVNIGPPQMCSNASCWWRTGQNNSENRALLKKLKKEDVFFPLAKYLMLLTISACFQLSSDLHNIWIHSVCRDVSLILCVSVDVMLGGREGG